MARKMYGAKTDRAGTQGSDKSQVFKIHNAWGNYRNQPLLCKFSHRFPIMFLGLLAGNSTASASNSFFKTPKRRLLSIGERRFPWNTVKGKRLSNSRQSLCDGKVILVNGKFDN